jgi:rhomboid protease GluP
MSASGTEVFRSLQRSACEERSLVLSALGISSAVLMRDGHFLLEVDIADLTVAVTQLRLYDFESRPAPPPPPTPRFHEYAWVGCVAYVAILLGVAHMIGSGSWRLDAFDAGELDAARIQSGQWWRAWTALTLHVDPAHIAANLGAGVWFGYLAGRQLGSGRAWFLIVNGAAFANWLEGELAPATHRAVGASTAVFTALGMLAAHSWRTRYHLPQRWALRWGPLVAGVVLLGWLGSAGESTDLVAHAMGFTMGGFIGAIAALPLVERGLERVPEWLAGLAAIAAVAVAWAFALRS